ncbi:PIG-L family deacetylase [Paenibacillus sp. H1-7]|uniref:PIG-L deacetylase family protein n=1 Tax=Paenibacillus sp. H1-7 TaxID=2282849 RepID=UPI001EF89E04|nr:PIG-L deacetylase family protein [Paenibacillus sp. H1-7]ULL14980.1 PIG-L family deacetylase [Paenibacillus sp. H1-7]
MTNHLDQLRVLMICAHPDEPDMYAGGLAALYAERGHRVKFLSLTNGDAGHFSLPKQEVAARRKQEARLAAQRLGIDAYEVLDHSDGMLEPSLALRHEVLRHIRAYEPDVLVTFHPEGGNSPDNRYTGKIVSDAVPYAGLPQYMPDPDAPYLKKKLLVLLMPDMSLHNDYRPDVAIDVSSVIEKKLLACDAHATTFYELIPWFKGTLDQVPVAWEDRKRYLLDNWPTTFYASPRMRTALEQAYGSVRAGEVRYAEGFEIARYSFKPDAEQLKRYIPMLGEG